MFTNTLIYLQPLTYAEKEIKKSKHNIISLELSSQLSMDCHIFLVIKLPRLLDMSALFWRYFDGANGDMPRAPWSKEDTWLVWLGYLDPVAGADRQVTRGNLMGGSDRRRLTEESWKEGIRMTRGRRKMYQPSTSYSFSYIYIYIFPFFFAFVYIDIYTHQPQPRQFISIICQAPGLETWAARYGISRFKLPPLVLDVEGVRAPAEVPQDGEATEDATLHPEAVRLDAPLLARLIDGSRAGKEIEGSVYQ